jgi:hypothetical protein
VLHWLDLAGQQGAAVHRHFIQDVHATQVQVDELWSFVKKNKSTCNRPTQTTGETPGSGVRSPCVRRGPHCQLQHARAASGSTPSWSPAPNAAPGGGCAITLRAGGQTARARTRG